MKQLIHELYQALTTIRLTHPLVHVIPNQVSATFCADAIAAIGARPIMGMAPQEVDTITAHSQSVVLNMGQPSTEKFESLCISAHSAVTNHIPTVFDPVGVGASEFRLIGTKQILSIPWKGIIRLNQSEYLTLAHLQLTYTGVDGFNHFDSANIPPILRKDTVFLITGETDFILSFQLKYSVRHLSSLSPHIVRTGCCLSSICGCFLSAGLDYLDAALASSLVLGIVSHKSSLIHSTYGDYKVSLLNQLSLLTLEDFETYNPC